MEQQIEDEKSKDGGEEEDQYAEFDPTERKPDLKVISS